MFGGLRRILAPKPPRAPTPPPFDAGLFDAPAASLYAALAERWAAEDADYAPALDADRDIDALEQRYQLRLPEDFRDYLSIAAPRTTYWDFQGTQWWTVAEIKSLADECPDWPSSNPEIDRERDRYLVFSDYLIWCYAWAICCSEGTNRGKVALIGGMPDGFVADSFREFLRLELADDLSIHSGAKG